MDSKIKRLTCVALSIIMEVFRSKTNENVFKTILKFILNFFLIDLK